MSIETYGGGMLSPTQVATVSGMTQEQLDTMTALVQLVDTKANQQYVIDQIAAVVGAAPGALDTLAEIAAQLGNDESAITALTNAVAGALRFDVAQSLTTPQKTQALDNLGVAAVGRTGSFNDLGDKASLLDTLLAGLSTAVSTAVLATDSIKTAIGKLQGQIISNTALLPTKIGGTWYKSGMWYNSFWPFTSPASGLAPNAGVQYFMKFTAIENKTFNAIAVGCTTAGVSGDNIQLGVYASDVNNNPMGLPVFVSSNLAVDTSGDKIATCNLTLTRGTTYWLSFVLLGTKQAGFRCVANVPFAFDGYNTPSDVSSLQVKYRSGVADMATLNASNVVITDAISSIINVVLKAA